MPEKLPEFSEQELFLLPEYLKRFYLWKFRESQENLKEERKGGKYGTTKS